MKVQNSARLTYQLMNSGDAQLLFELNQDPEVMKFISDGERSTMQEINDIHIPRLKSYTKADKGWGMWKVIITDSNQFIGWVLVRPMAFFSNSPELNNLELGWRFMKSAWGQGYATEAAANIKSAIARQGEAKQVTAIAKEDNFASIKIMKKLGMEFVKKGTHEDPLGNHEVVFYSANLKAKSNIK